MSGKPLVKICGITSVADAKIAIECGADFLGLVFAGGSRKISTKTGRAIREAVPCSRLVGVFANQPIEEVARVSRDCGLDFVQLHGDEDAEFCGRVHELLATPVIKAFEVRSRRDLDAISGFAAEQVCALLIDRPKRRRLERTETRTDGENRKAVGETETGIESENLETIAKSGVSPTPVHWQVAVEAKGFGKPVFVAGDLTPDTVASVVEKVKPFGVDVSSGVETAPGKKSGEKIALFVKRATGRTRAE